MGHFTSFRLETPVKVGKITSAQPTQATKGPSQVSWSVLVSVSSVILIDIAESVVVPDLGLAQAPLPDARWGGMISFLRRFALLLGSSDSFSESRSSLSSVSLVVLI